MQTVIDGCTKTEILIEIVKEKPSIIKKVDNKTTTVVVLSYIMKKL